VTTAVFLTQALSLSIQEMRLMHLLQHGTKNKKGYITANAVLLALFVMLIVQITMQNITAVTLQSRLFQATE